MPKFNVQVWRTHTVTETDFLRIARESLRA